MVSVAVVAPLSPAERAEFAKQRAIVLEHVDGYVTCGLALRTIQQGRLYRETHDTLADWCIAEIGLSRGRVYQLMDAAEVCQTMLDIGAPAPKNARQAAELKRVPEEHRVEVMEAVDARGDMSARAIQEEAAARGVSKTETTEPSAEAERPPLDGDSWCTPDDIVAMARTIMGSIDLDPASNAHAQNVVQAGQWFSKDDDGLDKKWEAANVWVNPPYSKPLISRFAERIMTAWEREPDVEQILALVNTSSASQWWHRLANGCSALAFRQGRVQFWHPQIPDDTPSTERDRNRYDQTLFYFGPTPDTFFSEVKAQGWLPMVVAP